MKYRGGRMKGMMVDRSITYAELLDRIYTLTKVNRVEFDLTIKYVLNFTAQDPPPVEIVDDNDVQMYMSIDDTRLVQLHVTIERKEVEVEINSPGHPTAPLNEDVNNPWERACDLSNRQYNNTQWQGSNCTSNQVTDRYEHVADEYPIAHEPIYPTAQLNEHNTPRWGSHWATDQVADEPEHGVDEFPIAYEYEGGTSMSVDHDTHRSEPIDDCHTFQGYEPEPTYVGAGDRPSSSRCGADQSQLITSMQCSSGEVDVKVGDIFLSKKDLSLKLNMVAMKRNFQFRVLRSTKDLLIVVCIKENCKWRLRAMALDGCDVFRVTKYMNEHTCEIDFSRKDHRQAKSWVIGQVIKSKFDEVGRLYRPRDIINDLRQDYGVNISYDKAWNAREKAIVLSRGTPEGSYNLLRAYGEALKIANPGTVFEVEVEDGNYFKYAFMSLGPSIRGFLACVRKVLVVDGTFLKNKYRGTLLVGASIDANNQTYPIGFGIVDRETDESWQWFLSNMRAALGEVEDLVIVSDRNNSIAKACSIVFPSAFHGLCIYHISNNLRAKYKNERIMPLYFTAAKAFRKSVFNVMWARLSVFEGVNTYLEEIGFERWARCFQGGRRYNVMTTNIAEGMNAILREARELPVTALFDHIRGVLQRWFHERRTLASSCTMPVSDYIDSQIREAFELARTYIVRPIDRNQFEVFANGDVDGVVNLHTHECSCKAFDYMQYPCSHALAASRYQGIDPYSLCHHTYTRNAWTISYAEPIFPVGNDVSEWPRNSEFADIEVLPPKTVARIGRRRVNRMPSVGEERRQRKCSRCGNIGHNRKTCTNPLRASIPES